MEAEPGAPWGWLGAAALLRTEYPLFTLPGKVTHPAHGSLLNV